MSIFLATLLAVGAAQGESCAAVRQDQQRFAAWAFATMKEMEAERKVPPSPSDRARGAAFEQATNAKIDDLNRRYAACRGK